MAGRSDRRFYARAESVSRNGVGLGNCHGLRWMRVHRSAVSRWLPHLAEGSLERAHAGLERSHARIAEEPCERVNGRLERYTDAAPVFSAGWASMKSTTSTSS